MAEATSAPLLPLAVSPEEQQIRDLNAYWLQAAQAAQRGDRMARSYRALLPRISTGQYSDPGRIFHEILQNCEDAPFARRPGGETRGMTVLFALIRDDDALMAGAPASLRSANGLLVTASNEDGFSPSNVESLCSAALSSKTASAPAADEDEAEAVLELDDAAVLATLKRFIGEKGIGFKSVFGYASAPHIFSRRYRFQFRPNAADNPLHMVTPYWVEDDATEAWARGLVHRLSGLAVDDTHGTVMAFPLLEPETFDKIADALGTFMDRPENILFLGQVDRVVLRLCRPGAADVARDFAATVRALPQYAQSTDATGALRPPRTTLLELTSHADGSSGSVDTTHRWLKTELAFRVPAAVREPARIGVHAVPIEVAFPLDLTDQRAVRKAGRLYAYLPTAIADLGLPCVINSDFILASSRESLDVTKPWNAFILQSTLAAALTIAFRCLVCHLFDGTSDAVTADRMRLLLGALPAASRVAPFLRTAATAAARQMLALPWVPVAAPGAAACLVDVLLAPAGVHALLSEEDRAELTLMPFAHVAVYAAARALLSDDEEDHEAPWRAACVLWDSRSWQRSLGITRWVASLRHDRAWFVRLWTTVAGASIAPAELASWKAALFPTTWPDGGAASGLVASGWAIDAEAEPWNAAFHRAGFVLQAVQPCLDLPLWTLCLASAPDVAQWLVRTVGLVSPFDREQYLATALSACSAGTAAASAATLVHLVNDALWHVHAGSSSASALARALQSPRLPLYNVDGALIARGASGGRALDYVVRPANACPELADFFSWSPGATESQPSAAWPWLRQRALDPQTVNDDASLAWRVPRSPGQKSAPTTDELTEVLFHDVLACRFDGRPPLPSRAALVAASPELAGRPADATAPLAVFPFLRASAEERATVAWCERFQRLLRWAVQMARLEPALAGVLESWKSEPWLPWHGGQHELWRPDALLHVAADDLLAQPEYLGPLDGPAAALLPLPWPAALGDDCSREALAAVGVVDWTGLPEAERALRLGRRWKAVLAPTPGAFETRLVRYLAQTTETWLALPKYADQRTQLIRLFSDRSVPLIAVAGAAGRAALDLDRLVLLRGVAQAHGAAASADGGPRVGLGALSGHPLWHQLAVTAVVVWTVDMVGPDMAKLLHALGARDDLTVDHAILFWRGLLAFFPAGAPPAQREQLTTFFWSFLQLVHEHRGANRIAELLAGGQPLKVLLRGQWRTAAEVMWAPEVVTTWSGAWTGAAGGDALLASVYEEVVGQFNLYDDAVQLGVHEVAAAMVAAARLATPVGLVDGGQHLLAALSRRQHPARAVVQAAWRFYAEVANKSEAAVRKQLVERFQQQAWLLTQAPQDGPPKAWALKDLTSLPRDSWWPRIVSAAAATGAGGAAVAGVQAVLEGSYDATIRPTNLPDIIVAHSTTETVEQLRELFSRGQPNPLTVAAALGAMLQHLRRQPVADPRQTAAAAWAIYRVMSAEPGAASELSQAGVVYHANAWRSFTDVQWCDRTAWEPALTEALPTGDKLLAEASRQFLDNAFRSAFDESNLWASAQQLGCDTSLGYFFHQTQNGMFGALVRTAELTTTATAWLAALKKGTPSAAEAAAPSLECAAWALLSAVATRLAGSRDWYSKDAVKAFQRALTAKELVLHEGRWCGLAQLHWVTSGAMSTLLPMLSAVAADNNDDERRGVSDAQRCAQTACLLAITSINLHHTVQRVLSDGSRHPSSELLTNVRHLLGLDVARATSQLPSWSPVGMLLQLAKATQEELKRLRGAVPKVDFRHLAAFSKMVLQVVACLLAAASVDDLKEKSADLCLPVDAYDLSFVPWRRVVLPNPKYRDIQFAKPSEDDDATRRYVLALPSWVTILKLDDAQRAQAETARARAIQQLTALGVPSLDTTFERETVDILGTELKEVTAAWKTERPFFLHPALTRIVQALVADDVLTAAVEALLAPELRIVQCERIERVIRFKHVGASTEVKSFRWALPESVHALALAHERAMESRLRPDLSTEVRGNTGYQDRHANTIFVATSAASREARAAAPPSSLVGLLTEILPYLLRDQHDAAKADHDDRSTMVVRLLRRWYKACRAVRTDTEALEEADDFIAAEKLEAILDEREEAAPSQLGAATAGAAEQASAVVGSPFHLGRPIAKASSTPRAGAGHYAPSAMAFNTTSPQLLLQPASPGHALAGPASPGTPSSAVVRVGRGAQPTPSGFTAWPDLPYEALGAVLVTVAPSGSGSDDAALAAPDWLTHMLEGRADTRPHMPGSALSVEEDQLSLALSSLQLHAVRAQASPVRTSFAGVTMATTSVTTTTTTATTSVRYIGAASLLPQQGAGAPVWSPQRPVAAAAATAEYVVFDRGWSTAQVGRWGELVAAREVLPEMFPEPEYTVRWMNEHGESGASHDFEVYRHGAADVHRWIEVKATTDKAEFFWSLNELALAHRVGPAYTLLRITGYGQNRPPLVRRIDHAIAAVRSRAIEVTRVVARLNLPSDA